MLEQIQGETILSRQPNIVQREAIIRASYTLFLENGYEAVTTRRIAEECGISRSLLHHYYNKKEEIILEVFGWIASKLSEFWFSKTSMSDRMPGYGVYGANILLRIGDHRSGMERLFVDIARDGDLTIQFILNLMKATKRIDNEKLVTNEDIGSFIFFNTFMHLILLRDKDLIEASTQQIIDMSLRTHYLYIGYTEDFIKDTFTRVKQINIDAYIIEFIEYYETMF